MMSWDGGGGPLPPSHTEGIKGKTKMGKAIVKPVSGSITNAVDKALKDVREKTVASLPKKDNFFLDNLKRTNKYFVMEYKYDEEKNKTTVSQSYNSSFTLNRELTLDEVELIHTHNAIAKKKFSKDDAKKKVDIRYKIGDILVLRGKIKDGSRKLVKKFEVKKVIWSIKANPVNILILKQIEGENNNSTLSREDCKKYHIKYEEGLQVYSMMMNFGKISKKLLK